MAKPQGKQIDILVGEGLSFTGTLGLPTAVSVVVTANHSGEVSGGDNTTVGTYTASPQNKVFIRLKDTGKAVEDDSQRQIFGRLTESASIWTLSFYVLIAGVETVYDFTGHADVGSNIEYTYFHSIQIGSSSPTNVVNLFENIDEINASSPLSHQHKIEVKTIVSQNTIPSLVEEPKDSTDVKLIVNKLAYTNNVDFTIVGKVITWVQGTAGFDIETTDEVVVVYEY